VGVIVHGVDELVVGDCFPLPDRTGFSEAGPGVQVPNENDVPKITMLEGEEPPEVSSSVLPKTGWRDTDLTGDTRLVEHVHELASKLHLRPHTDPCIWIDFWDKFQIPSQSKSVLLVLSPKGE
jgi:hypothetical protein